MREIKIISKFNVAKIVNLIDPDTVLALAAKSFYLASKSLAQMPKRLVLSSPKHKLLIMPSMIPKQEIVKMVGIPLSSNGLSSSSVVLSSDTGALEWVVNSEAITAIRTASGSALITKAVCLNAPKVLLVFGSGLQAYWHTKVLLKVLPNLEKVTIFSRSLFSAEKLVFLLKTEFIGITFSIGELKDIGNVEKVPSELERSLNSADIICSCTPSTLPFIYGSLVKKGAHINCIGSYTPDMQEFDIEVIKNSTIFVDSKEMVLKEAGEIVQTKDVLPTPPDLLELGNFVVPHNLQETENFILDFDKVQNEIQKKGAKFTLFKSVGIATQDLTLTCQICALADSHGFYEKVSF